MLGTVIFAVNVLQFALLGTVLFVLTGREETTITKKIRGFAKPIAIGSMVLSLLFVVLDAAGAAGNYGYRYLSFYTEIFAGIVLLTARSRRKTPDKQRAFLPFMLRTFTICLVLELFVFNLNSAHLFGGDYPQQTLDLRTAVSTNIDPVTGKTIGEGNASIEFLGLNQPVGTLTICGESDTNTAVTFTVDMKDVTNSGSYRANIASAQVIRGSERTQTIPCNFSGTVYDLRINFSTKGEEIVTITGISINQPIMLHFSLVRFLLLFLGALGIYALASKEILYQPYPDKRRLVRRCAWAATAVLIVFSLVLTNMNRYRNENHSIANDFQSSTGNQITKEIVDAFAAGSLELDIPMNEQLLELDNPYDWSQRKEIGSYPWDHLLYEGKYYSYYGIGPVLVLFLPYHLLTGYYFPSTWAVWLFGIFGIFFLTKLYLCFADKFFRRMPASFVLTGLLIMQLSTGIFFCFYHGNFYEIAQASGFLGVTAGAYFLLSANVIGEGKIANWRLAVSAFCLSMAVLCRPTLAVYCIAALLFIFAGFCKKRSLREKQDTSHAKYYAPYFCCALIPFAVIGAIQMLYNYARFGSFLDFGIQYSLTINDFTTAQYHTHFVWIGFFNYLLIPPAFVENFPFFKVGSAMTFQPQGYYFLATTAALGLLWRALPILAYGKSLRAYSVSKSENKKLYAWLLFAVCIACPFAIMFSIWESGYGTRYCVDFAWQIILGALVICAVLYEKSHEETKKYLNHLMVVSCVISLIMNAAQIYAYNNPTTAAPAEWQTAAYEFARLFEFWR